ncbi:hypothetical protein NMG60_11002932 [Bertholletia excelsa]
MDVDFWPSRVHSNKHLSVLQASRLGHSSGNNRLYMDGSEGDDDTRAYFPCPFCYIEIELPTFCSHLQKEHCFDFKNAVCPLCAANLGKDAIGHFTVQHSHSVKRRRKSQKSGYWSNSSSMLGNNLRELRSFLGSTLKNERTDMHDYVPDPLLSPFLCPLSVSDSKGCLDIDSSKDATSTISCMASSDELQGQDSEEKRQRAAFIQQVILSTIF